MLIKLISLILRRKHAVFISQDTGSGMWVHQAHVDCQVYEMLPALTYWIERLPEDVRSYLMKMLAERETVNGGVVVVCEDGEYYVDEDGVHHGHMKLGRLDLGLPVGTKFNLKEDNEETCNSGI